MNKTLASVSLLVFTASLAVAGMVFAYGSAIPLPVQAGVYVLAAITLAGLLFGLRDYPVLLREQRFARSMDNRLQQCMDLAEVIYVVLDRNGRVVTINDTGCRLLELPRADIVGKNWFEHFIPAGESGKVKKVFESVMSGEIQGVEYYENRIQTGRGGEHVIFWHNTYITDDNNQIAYTLSAGMDLTDRLDIETRLRQSESKYHLLLNTLPYGVQEIDLDGNIVYSNPEHDRLYGYATGTMIGRNICDLPASETARRELRDYLALLVREQPAPEPYESQDCRRDGTLFDCHVTWNYKRDEHGKLTGFIAVLSDTTRQKNTERALREAYREMETRVGERTAQLNAARELLQRTLDASPDWIYAKDSDFRFLVANRSFAAAQGLHPRQMINRLDSDFWHTEYCQSDDEKALHNAHCDDRRALAGEIIHEPHDVTTLHDGSVRIFDTIKGPLRNPDGEIYGVFAYARDVTEKVQAEERLDSSYKLLDAIFENTHVMIAVLDVDMNFIRVNHPYAAVENRPPEYFAGKNHFALYPSTENEAIFRKVVETGTPVDIKARAFEYSGYPERGVTHWDWTLAPIFDATGKVNALVLSLLDVTTRIRALEDLATREQELRQLNVTLEQRVQARTADLEETHSFTQAIIDTVSALILVMDTSGRIVRFNHACELTSGYSAEEALGRYPWDFLIPKAQRANVRQVFDDLACGQFPGTYENEWRHKSGAKRVIAWSNTCMTDAQGKVLYVIATGLDITERKKTEEALALSEEKYRAMMSYASDAMMIATLDGKLIETNARGLELLGYRKDEFLALAIPDIHPPEELPRIQQVFQEMIETGSGLYSDGFVLTRDRQTIPIEIACTVIEYGGQQVALGIFRDISARKRAEQKRLEQERRHRETLVREVHHRIKNNLQGLIGLLRDNLTDAGEGKDALDRAVAQIRTISLIHGMQARDVSSDLRLCDVTRAIFEQLQGLAPQDIRLEFRDQVSAPVLLQEQDAIPVALIINELITNAIKHLPADTPDRYILVTLNGSAVEGMEFSVFSKGARLPADLDLFAGKGLGMGLDLVRSLVPRKHASFELYEDEGGVFAQLLLGAPLIRPTGDA